jgi:hypothetical protein
MIVFLTAGGGFSQNTGKGAAVMTTVDVYTRKADSGAAFSLHNGLFGAATTALHALISAFEAGTISRPWPSSYIDTTVKGTVERSMVVGIGELDLPYHRQVTGPDWRRSGRPSMTMPTTKSRRSKPEAARMGGNAGERQYRTGL